MGSLTVVLAIAAILSMGFMQITVSYLIPHRGPPMIDPAVYQMPPLVDPVAPMLSLDELEPPLPTEETTDSETIVETFHVKSDIRYRFATTQMESRVRNIAGVSKSVNFEVTLPKEAFIMSFNMEIDGKVYDGEVKEKSEAKKQYLAAVDKGQSAGHIRQAPRHANIFQVDVNVANGSAVTFTLTYQEVLRRKLGKYEHEVHVDPGQAVEDFLIEVAIRENKPLTFVNSPALRKDTLISNEVEPENKNAQILRPTPNTAHILYEPDLGEQGDNGLSARFAVQYDIEHSSDGEVAMVDGYFVHFFSPDYQPMPKDIVFVLDVSGSMYGQKMAQLKKAMSTILEDLRPNDRFNIFTFSSRVSRWKEGLVDANKGNVLEALAHVDQMVADGMTNINQALLDAVEELKRRRNQERVAMIFFLTDGLPTQGEEDPQLIAANVWAANENNALIYSLAFGSGADFDSLVQVSVQNNGFARKIYEASDAALQVSSLYKEISAVAMKDVKVNYLPEAVDEFSITETEFPVIFNGSEIIICGIMDPEVDVFQYEISGRQSKGDVDIVLEVDDMDNTILPSEDEGDLFSAPRDFAGIVEKMWAFLTIKQLLLEKERSAQDEQKVKTLKEKVLKMSIKYKFVTPLTSMVVTKPDDVEGEEKTETGLTDSDMLESADSLPGTLHSVASTISQRQHQMVPDPSLGQAYYYDPRPMSGLSMPGQSLGPSYSQPRRRKLSYPRHIATAATATARTRTTTITTARPPHTPQEQYGSLLSSILVSHQGQQSVCMIPKRWRVGKYNLFETQNGIKVILETECSQTRCRVPNLKRLIVEKEENSADLATIELNGFKDWKFDAENAGAFQASVNVNNMGALEIMLPGINVITIEKKLKKKTRNFPGPAYLYSFKFSLNQVHVGGLVADYSSMADAELSKMSNRRATRECRTHAASFSVLLKQKNMKSYSIKTRKNRNKNGRNNRKSKSRQ